MAKAYASEAGQKLHKQALLGETSDRIISADTIPGIGRVAAETGRVGLPEATRGEWIDRLTLPAGNWELG